MGSDYSPSLPHTVTKQHLIWSTLYVVIYEHMTTERQMEISDNLSWNFNLLYLVEMTIQYNNLCKYYGADLSLPPLVTSS
jgi:hypothetical protein